MGSDALPENCRSLCRSVERNRMPPSFLVSWPQMVYLARDLSFVRT